MSDFLTRLELEAEELNAKLRKLQEFMYTEAFYKLPESDQWPLDEQQHAMNHYLSIIRKRIAKAKGWIKTDEENLVGVACNTLSR